MRKITVAICLDNKGGMTFLGKRQSRDRVLIEDLVKSTDGEIYISDFSSVLFAPYGGRYRVVDNPLTDTPDGAVSFIENLPLSEALPHIDRIIMYKWNRVYPSDKKIDIRFDDFKVISESEFVGSSHGKISKVILERK